MGYLALLFCPDDKTARTVTQVLSELEFNVEACTEPFAAVKKLMGQHFDAVVVDCDNEQNATLLFKSARNSTPNQTSLAVAVVEGQAGVAKAFRIGANLVLTKPINIEQAKGTLRVARGLLRKSEPGKPVVPAIPTPTTPAATVAAAPAKPAPRPPLGAKPVPPAPASVTTKPSTPPAISVPQPPPVANPAAPPAWPAVAAASTAPTAQDDDLLGIDSDKAAAAATSASEAYRAAERPIIPPLESKPQTAHVSFGAASAPAPAREPQKAAEGTAAAVEKAPEPPAYDPGAYVGSAPSFGYGSAGNQAESSGGGKKVFIGVAVAILVAVGAYFGVSHFKGGKTETTPAPIAETAANPQPPKSSPSIPAASTPAPVAVQPEVLTPAGPKTPAKPITEREVDESDSRPVPSPSKPESTPEASTKSETQESNALIVKGGKAPTVSTKSAPAPDAPPPSMIGMATSTSTPLPNLGTGSDSEVKPVLQTLSISQGVSQGLLYKKVAPTYPPAALRMRVEGIVELQATISKEGDITKIKVISGDPQLAKAASDAVKQWKYKPYLLNGEPVEIQTGVTINFKLPH